MSDTSDSSRDPRGLLSLASWKDPGDTRATRAEPVFASWREDGEASAAPKTSPLLAGLAQRGEAPRHEPPSAPSVADLLRRRRDGADARAAAAEPTAPPMAQRRKGVPPGEGGLDFRRADISRADAGEDMRAILRRAGRAPAVRPVRNEPAMPVQTSEPEPIRQRRSIAAALAGLVRRGPKDAEAVATSMPPKAKRAPQEPPAAAGPSISDMIARRAQRVRSPNAGGEPAMARAPAVAPAMAPAMRSAAPAALRPATPSAMPHVPATQPPRPRRQTAPAPASVQAAYQPQPAPDPGERQPAPIAQAPMPAYPVAPAASAAPAQVMPVAAPAFYPAMPMPAPMQPAPQFYWPQPMMPQPVYYAQPPVAWPAPMPVPMAVPVAAPVPAPMQAAMPAAQPQMSAPASAAPPAVPAPETAPRHDAANDAVPPPVQERPLPAARPDPLTAEIDGVREQLRAFGDSLRALHRTRAARRIG